MTQRVSAWFARVRRRFGWVDHVVRAGIRYDHADGGRLAAAITYYAFFAVFAGALLGFAVLGYVLDQRPVLTAVQNYLTANLPRLDVNAIRNARDAVGVIAFVVLPVAGLFWVDAMRSSIRAIWHLDQYPGTFLRRQIIDLGILACLIVLLAASLTVSSGTQALLHWLVVDAGNADGSVGQWLLSAVGEVFGVVVNTVLAAAVLTMVPRIHICRHRVFAPALLVAVGLEILNTAGRIYVQRAEANPAYQVVAAAVGLLVFLSLLNQLILFAAALTATSTHGLARDFATRPPVVAAPVPAVNPAASAGVTGIPGIRRARRRRTVAYRRPPGKPH